MVNNSKSQGLKKNYLSFLEVFAFSFGMLGASGSVVILIPLVFANAGNGSWLAFLLSATAYLLVAAQINVFARRLATPGAIYVYVKEGWGPLSGAVAGWSLFLGYFACVPLNAVAVPYYLILCVHTLTGYGDMQNIKPLLIGLSIVITAIAWAMAYRDVKLSARTTLIIEFLTIGLLSAVVGTYFWHSGLHIDHDQVTLKDVSFKQFALGLVLAMASFTGFDAATTLGTEAKSPFKSVPRAIFLTILIGGLFIIICTYALVQAFHGFSTSLGTDEAPLSTFAQSLGLGGLAPFIFGGVAVSWFSCLLGCFNTGSRLLYSFSEHGLFHRKAKRSHVDFATPHIAISFVALVGLFLTIVLELQIGAMDIIGYTASLAAFGFLFAYILTAIAAVLYLRHKNQLKIHHMAFSTAAVILMMIPIVGSVYPVPDWPYTILPFIFLASLTLGTGYFLYLRSFKPDSLNKIGIEQVD